MKKFVADANAVGLNGMALLDGPKLLVKVAKLDAYGSGVIGLCQTGRNSRTVTLDPDFFGQYGEVQDRILAHHEFGHCLLYRPHRSSAGVIPDGSGHSHELSIMYPTIMSTMQYEYHEGYYLEELFEQLSTDRQPKTYICQ